MNGSDPFAEALRLLGRRDRSAAEVRSRLRLKGHADDAVEATLDRCRQLGYLDDGRFALERARALMAAGRAVGPRVMADLAARGIGETEARTALDEAVTEFPADNLLRDLVRRRYSDFQYAAATDPERRRVVNYFLRRGFPLPLVLSILKEER